MAETLTNIEITPDAFVLDAHLVRTFHSCEQKYNYFELQHLIPAQPAVAPSFGIAMHEGVAGYRSALKNGLSFNDAANVGLIVLERAYAKHMPEHMHSEVMQDDRRSITNAKRLFIGLCEYLEPQSIIYEQIEIPFAILIGRVGGRDIIYTGIMDAILTMQGRTYVNDLKGSAWSINQNWLESWRMDQGLIGYVVATRTLLGLDIYQALVHAMWIQAEPKSGRGKPLNEYFHVQPLSWTQRQLDEWQDSTLESVDRIFYAVAKGKFTMDFNDACKAYGGCPYRPLCWEDSGVRPHLIKNQYARALWSPLEDERLVKLEN